MTERFFNPTEVRWMSWEQTGALLPPPPLRVAVIVGRSSMHRAQHLRDGVLSAYNVRILPAVPADPTTGTVQALLDDLRVAAPDWVIAMGGGSVLDSAKAAALLAKSEGAIADYLHGERPIKYSGIPVIAIPTTGGSGSEVTPYASITDMQLSKKVSLTSDYLFPRYAVMDSSLTLSLPPKQTGISGMDALSHAIEGYWSNGASAITDVQALEAAKLAMTALTTAYSEGDNCSARSDMLNGSLLAGIAISNARTTAVHATSYPMTVLYRVPHGLACGALLPAFIRYNNGAMSPEKENLLLGRLSASSMEDLALAVEDLRTRIGMPGRLSNLGLDRDDIKVIVKNAFRPDRVGNNPREVTSARLTELLVSLL